MSLALASVLVGVADADPGARRPVTLEQADRARSAEECTAAIPVFRQAVEEVPGDGLSHYNLGYCLYVSGELEQAESRFRAAAAFSSHRADALYAVAATAARRGALERALAVLAEYVVEGERRNDQNAFWLLSDPDFEPLASDPRFHQLVGRLAGPGYQAGDGGEWRPSSVRRGVDFVLELIDERHPDPYRYVSKEELRKHGEALVARGAELSLATYALELMRLVGMVGDIHTSVWVRSGAGILEATLPLRLWRFSDGLFIRAAAPGHEELIGSKVVEIGSFDVEEGWDRLVADNPRENEWMATSWLQFLLLLPEFHVARGWSGDAERVELTLETVGGERVEVSLEPVDEGRFGAALESSIGLATPEGWLEGNPGGAEMPLWLQARSARYWSRPLDEAGAIYAAVNHPRGDLTEWRAFLDDLFARIASAGTRKLVVDLRHNTGGYDYIAQELIHRVIRADAVNRPGGLCVITSRSSQSAGVTFAALLERETPAVIVGEPAGGAPNYYNGPQGFFSPKAIPGAPLRIRYSSTAESFSDPKDTRRGIAPDIWAPMSWADFARGEDPALAACQSLDEAAARSFHRDPGGREIPLYFKWRRPSQAAMFPNGRLPRQY